MKKAAIIIYGYNSNKIMFWVLGKPFEIGRISIELDEEAYEIVIFEVPHTKENKYKIKLKRIIEKFCGENNIQSIFYADDKDEQLESAWYAIKILCVLREIEIITGEAISGKSYGIVSSSLNQVLIEAISEEASSIMILRKGLDQTAMEKLYKKIMIDKGLSVAYVNDVSFLMNQSRIVLWESSAPVSSNISLGKVLISTQQIDIMKPDDVQIKYEEEIGKIIIKLAYKMNILKIASHFPFVYFLDSQGYIMKREQVCLSLTRSNKPLTIQKC